MTTPTSALDFSDLQTEVALLLGIAYYGVAGDAVPQPPTDTQDLSKVERIVNNAIRMLISNGPSSGWSWLRPTTSVDLWADVAVDSDVTATGVYDGDTYTTITASEASFYESMELHDIVVTDVGTYEIVDYVSTTQVKILGDHAFATKTFSIDSGGNFTLPDTFGGEYDAPLRYQADSGIATPIYWGTPNAIKYRRQISGSYSGYPNLAAVRKTTTAQRWELMVSPEPGSALVVEMTYPLHFDSLTADTDLHPAGFQFDEVVLAACKARAEMEDASLVQGNIEYYRQSALPDALKIDAQNRPKSVGSIRLDTPRRRIPYTRTINNSVSYGS